jgi:choline dehydrogenase-like flavoprotein
LIRDLVSAGQATINADVLVIGGGTAGLLVASRLAEKGFKVVVLESGGLRQDEEEHPLNEVVQLRSVYSGADHGRYRCLGGTSTRWGGALIPFLPADMGKELWPVSYNEVSAYLPAVERLFGLSSEPYECSQQVQTDGAPPSFVARRAKWPSFAKRNVANLLSSRLGRSDGPEIWLNATVTQFAIAENGRLQQVVAEAPDKSGLAVQASETIIAAGCIESTRLLLLADRQNRSRYFAPHGVLGRYLHDHLSVRVADIDPKDRSALNRVAGFSFEAGGSMRNLRFELADCIPRGKDLTACFAHIAFAERDGGGFNALRGLLRQLQQRRPPGFMTLIDLIRASPWLLRALWWRFYERRLLYPSNADIQLHMVIEQRPKAENRILISADRRDIYGQPLAIIDWSVNNEDELDLTRATDGFLKTWANNNLAQFGTIRRRPSGEAEAELALGGGIYHPAGTIRMARRSADGVVDRNLTTFPVPNLHVISTAVFPALGGASPTMTLLMLALRLCDHLAAKAGKRCATPC